SSTSFPAAKEQTLYSPGGSVSFTGGTGPFTCALASGSIPSGLAFTSGSFSASPCTLTGTPPAGSAGVYTFTVTITDSLSHTATTSSQSLTVNGPPNITTTTLPSGTVNSAYSQTLQATGGSLPYTWSINGGGTLASQGAACAALSLSSSGVISGTPTTAGTCSFTAKVTDQLQNSDTQALAITVNAAAAKLPSDPDRFCAEGTGTEKTEGTPSFSTYE